MTLHPAVSNGSYDVAKIRADFPALAMQVYGKPLVYLDNAASAQKPQAGARPHPEGLYRAIRQRASRAALSRQRGDRSLRGRARDGARASSMPGAPEEIIFTRNATEAINLVAYTFGRERIKAGDEIVLSIMEHHSNIVPWHFLRERQGAVIKWAPVDDEGNFLIDEFEKLLAPAHQDGRDHADVERARHRGAGEGGGEARACARHSGAGRRRARRGASRRRRARYRLRLLCLHRPQALRADRDRRALRQIRSARGHAAVQRRRRDDPATCSRTASPMASRRTASRPARRRSCRRSGSARRIDYVNSIGKARIRAHEGALVKYAQERLRRRSIRCASSATRRTRGRSSRSR